MSGRTGVGNKIGLILLVYLSLMVLFIVISMGRGKGAVLTVDDDPGGGDFTSIQEAIGAAEDGDTIRVFDGEYDESPVIDKRLSLIGNSSGTTFLDGGDGFHSAGLEIDDIDTITIIANGVIIRGFTISRGDITNRDESAGIRINSEMNTIHDCVFEDTGRGIAVEGDSNTITQCVFNTDFGIEFLSVINITLRDNTFHEAGIRFEGDLLDHWSSHTIDQTNSMNGGSIIYLANENGGAVLSGVSTVILVNCTNISIDGHNYSNGSSDASIILHTSSFNQIINSSFSSDTFAYMKDIILINSHHNLIRNNSISRKYYAYIYLDKSHNNTIIHNNISSKSWSNNAIYLTASNDNLIRSNVLTNQFRGIQLVSSMRNVVDGNTLGNADYMNCISVDKSNDTIISRNNLSNSNYGYAIQIQSSFNITLLQNTIVGNGLNINGELAEHFSTHTIDSSNIIGNRSIIYLKDQVGGMIPRNAGQIILANCSNIQVRNQNITNTTYGVYLAFCSGITIGNCTFERNNYGIYLRNSSGNSIRNSSIRLNHYAGIYLSSCWDNVIQNNTLEFNDVGLSFEGSEFCSLWNNRIVSNGKKGIHLEGSTSIVMESNSLSGGGLFIEGEDHIHWNSHTIPINNTVDGKPLYYYVNVLDSAVPAEAGQVIICNSTNITVEDQKLAERSGGLYVRYSSRITIRNVTISNGEVGVTLIRSPGTILEHNVCNNNDEGGISIEHSPDSILLNNICSGNGDIGISIADSEGTEIDSNECAENGDVSIKAQRSDHLQIRANTCSYERNGAGIILLQSNHSTIEANTCFATHLSDYTSIEWQNDAGIYIEDTHHTIIMGNDCSRNTNHGICVYTSSSITIENNTCSSNQYGSGIYIRSSWKCVVQENTCKNNDHHYGDGNGIRIDSSSNCTVTSNSCTHNERGLSVFTSFDCYFEANDFTRNDQHGIRVGSWYELSDCERNVFIGNDCSDTRYYSIEIYGAKNNTFESNICSSSRTGISMTDSSGNIFHENSVRENEGEGIRVSRSPGNSITTNTITGNSVGFLFRNGSTDNLIENNGIYGNIDYGISTAENASLIINATNNWWGHESGPNHPTDNVDGRGDRVVGNVQITPWLTHPPGEGDEEEDPDEENELLLLLLMIVLVGLILALILVVRQPGWAPSSGMRSPSDPHGNITSPAASTEKEGTSTSTLPPISCQYCDKEFHPPKDDSSIRITCPNCGKDTVSEEFRGSGAGDPEGFDE